MFNSETMPKSVRTKSPDWPLVAARSLDQHLRAVAVPLAAGDLAAARGATAMIVGRDVTRAERFQPDTPGALRG